MALLFWKQKQISEDADFQDPEIRKTYGTYSSIFGICCNLLLFGLKYTVGTLSNSIAILSDAFNNLSDCASCLVTLFGFKLAAKPADRQHPFGHGRMEYLTSLVIAAMILLMGFELLYSSIQKLLHPEAVQFRLVTLFMLLASVGIKLWMAHINIVWGTKLHAPAMLAAAKDSRSDVVATGATIAALLFSLLPIQLPIDGIIGAAVSIVILKSGYEIIRDTVGDLLGKPADAETVSKLKALVLQHPMIEGLHDLVLHDYGPGKMLGSCHVEVRSNVRFTAVHEVVDQIEREIYEQMHILMTIHMDPVELENQQVCQYRAMTEQVLSELDESLSMHDFRLIAGNLRNRLVFDVLVPFDCTYSDAALQEAIEAALKRQDSTCVASITFDRDYTESISQKNSKSK